jgi:hypothetical protein
LSEPQKKEYIDAVLCLSKKPAISGIEGTVHRFDDHTAVHNSQTPAIHFVVCLTARTARLQLTFLGPFPNMASLLRCYLREGAKG